MTDIQNQYSPVTTCRALIKRIDDLLHDKDSEAAHAELHELAHEFEILMSVDAQRRGLDPATVEACAKVAENWYPSSDVADAIRALAPGNDAVEANEYQPRTVERLIELLRSFEYGPRSWQSEAADALERLRRVSSTDGVKS